MKQQIIAWTFFTGRLFLVFKKFQKKKFTTLLRVTSLAKLLSPHNKPQEAKRDGGS